MRGREAGRGSEHKRSARMSWEEGRARARQIFSRRPADWIALVPDGAVRKMVTVRSAPNQKPT